MKKRILLVFLLGESSLALLLSPKRRDTSGPF